ncbi:MAG: PIN domain-containing protein, partial [Pirellulales bacterium]
MINGFECHMCSTSEEALTEIWNNATIVFDANVLLDIYRVTEKTRSDLMEVVTSYATRIWLPQNVVKEFFANRLSVISDQIGTCTEVIDSLHKLSEKLRPSRSQPHVDVKKMDALIGDVKETQKWLRGLFRNDTLSTQLFKQIQNIGEPLKDQVDIEKTALERYRKKVPPGFLDIKSNNPSECKFGDYINWISTIKYAQENQTSVIFVTNENGEDWFFEKSVVLPELRQEFLNCVGKEILIHSSSDFLKIANERNSNVDVSNDSIEELALPQLSNSVAASVRSLIDYSRFSPDAFLAPTLIPGITQFDTGELKRLFDSISRMLESRFVSFEVFCQYRSDQVINNSIDVINALIRSNKGTDL